MAAKRQSLDLGPQEGIGDGPAAESNDEDRRSRIAIAAYYKAERRGFSAEGQLDDWLAAEQEINLAKRGSDAEQEENAGSERRTKQRRTKQREKAR